MTKASPVASGSPGNLRIALLLSIAVTAVLWVVPYGHTIGYPLVLLSTIAHEMGHGLAAVMAGGSFDRFVVHLDASGTAYTLTSGSRFARAFVSAGGLCGPACVAALGFVLARKPRLARYALLGGGGFLAFSLLWVVRNAFGWVIVGAFAAGCLLVAVKTSEKVACTVLVFLSVQLSMTVFSRSDYLFTPVAHMATGDTPSDVANIASALFLPYWFWGAVCGLFSVAVLFLGARAFLRAAVVER